MIGLYTEKTLSQGRLKKAEVPYTFLYPTTYIQKLKKK